MTSRKHPFTAFWATVVVVALLAYPLSFGPACWFTSHTGAGILYLREVYRPVLWLMSHVDVAARLFNWYAQLGAPPDWAWLDFADSGPPVWLWSRIGK
jgi:hypothetical protein